MGKKISITDIANALGISKTTVSRALSGKGRVGESTKTKVLDYIEEHDAEFNSDYGNKSLDRTHNIAISIPSGQVSTEGIPFFQSCLQGILEEASKHNYDVMVSMNNNKNLGQLQRIIEEHKVDGVVVTRTLANDEQVELLKNSGMPFVTVGSYNGRDVVQVDDDHEKACADLTERLIHKGYHKIALISGNSAHVVTQTRTKGFLEGMRANGESNAGSFIFQDSKDNLEDVIKTIMSRHFDCIIGMDDSITTRVLEILAKLRISVPRDIKLASFYNSEALNKNTPPVTTLDFSGEDLGSKACDILIKMIEGKDVPRKTLIDYNVLMKKSTE